MGIIDTYKSKIGYGARNNLFKISFNIPPAVLSLYRKVNNEDVTSEIDLMVDRCNMPHTRNIDALTRINFGNEYFTVAKSRQMGDGGYEEITLGFRNTEKFKVRDLFSVWLNSIQKPSFGTYNGVRLTPEEYKANNFKIQLLDKDKATVIREVECFGVFPLELDNFDLGYEGGKEEMKSTDLRLSVDYYYTKPSGVASTLIV